MTCHYVVELRIEVFVFLEPWWHLTDKLTTLLKSEVSEGHCSAF